MKFVLPFSGAEVEILDYLPQSVFERSQEELMRTLNADLQTQGKPPLTAAVVTDALHRLRYKDIFTPEDGWFWEGLALLS